MKFGESREIDDFLVDIGFDRSLLSLFPFNIVSVQRRIPMRPHVDSSNLPFSAISDRTDGKAS